MKRFRIGNDISIVWEVKKNKLPADLEGKEISLYYSHPRGREKVADFVVDGNNLSFTFDGMSQSVLGPYTITADIRYSSGSRYLIQDKTNAFELVSRSEQEDPEDSDYTIKL